MQIIDNTALRLVTDESTAQQIVSTLERSQIVSNLPGSKELIVGWDHHEASYLATSTNLDVPSPMLRDYNWPGTFTPFEHQKKTASFLSLRRRAFCFNEAGTGKTSAAIWAADYLMTIGKIKRVLVICPLSIMYSAWRDDIFHTAMHRSSGIAHGSAQKRKDVIGSGCDFVIINFDGVKTVAAEIAQAKFDLIIIDEANAYKDASTQRWKTLAKIMMPSTWLWMMTGTPASQSPEDAFGLAKLVSPGNVPKYKTAWRDLVLQQMGKFRWIPRPDSRSRVYKALQPAVRFTKRECLDLPDVVYQTRDVPLQPNVAAFYKRMKGDMLIQAAGEQVTAVHAAANLSKLLQISGGAVYSDDKNVVEFDISPRLKALKEVLDETSHKVLVFVPFKHTIDIVARYLTGEKVSHEIINGDVTARNRSIIIDKFQKFADPKVLIIQPQSASHGVTLTAADTIVFWAPVMSVETYIQCIGRIDRVGQKHKMTVVHLQGSEVEHRMFSMLQGKVDSHKKLTDLYKQELGLESA